jgi:hypothetical protein
VGLKTVRRKINYILLYVTKHLGLGQRVQWRALLIMIMSSIKDWEFTDQLSNDQNIKKAILVVKTR